MLLAILCELISTEKSNYTYHNNTTHAGRCYASSSIC